jgi:hypothetical protein
VPACPPRILYVTDVSYQARGRRYCDEDIRLSACLRGEFTVALCHPLDAARLMDRFDLVVVRNSGPVLHYLDAYRAFREQARATGVRVYNPLHGRGDMAGKGYLRTLWEAGHPVIPTAACEADLARLPDTDTYVVKPVLGADSHGMEFVPRDLLLDSAAPAGLAAGTLLVQPKVAFRYEVSFYFVDEDFQYALYAPDPGQRWLLEPYEADGADIAFARRFVEWNALGHGIQRVDACRTREGDLLLVELEDLNPYLSLDLVTPAVREAFVRRMTASLHGALAGPRPAPADG